MQVEQHLTACSSPALACAPTVCMCRSGATAVEMSHHVMAVLPYARKQSVYSYGQLSFTAGALLLQVWFPWVPGLLHWLLHSCGLLYLGSYR